MVTSFWCLFLLFVNGVGLSYGVELFQFKFLTGVFLVLVVVANIVSMALADTLLVAFTNKFY